MIEPGRFHTTVPVTELVRMRFSPGRLVLPVSHGSAVRFEHIVGFPSGSDGEGFSLSKLRMLDSLIDRLVRLQKKTADSGEVVPKSPEAVDRMIRDLTKELHSALLRAAATPFGTALGAGAADNGLLLNLSA